MNITTLRKMLAALGMVLVSFVLSPISQAADSADYTVKPGDILIVNIWKDQDLTREVLVRPDGKISFPLTGDIQGAGHTVEQVRQDIVGKIQSYIPDVVATVMVKEIAGNKAYVVGKVLKPGPIIMTEPTNVMQALSLAGGTAQFAGLSKIKILRGQGGRQTAIPFNYGQVEDGEKLDQHITLQAGDVVVVP